MTGGLPEMLVGVHFARRLELSGGVFAVETNLPWPEAADWLGGDEGRGWPTDLALGGFDEEAAVPQPESAATAIRVARSRFISD
jgi:hypothetical protein